jgi:hypothetical protein
LKLALGYGAAEVAMLERVFEGPADVPVKYVVSSVSPSSGPFRKLASSLD